MMNDLLSRTSRMRQRRGSCPGSTVVHHTPRENGPSSWQWAGGSSQCLNQANDKLISASTESSKGMFFIMREGRSSLECHLYHGLLTYADARCRRVALFTTLLPKTRRTGAAARNVVRSGSSGAKESAILRMQASACSR